MKTGVQFELGTENCSEEQRSGVRIGKWSVGVGSGVKNIAAACEIGK
jgi:hypothetical protein